MESEHLQPNAICFLALENKEREQSWFITFVLIYVGLLSKIDWTPAAVASDMHVIGLSWRSQYRLSCKKKGAALAEFTIAHRHGDWQPCSLPHVTRLQCGCECVRQCRSVGKCSASIFFHGAPQPQGTEEPDKGSILLPANGSLRCAHVRPTVRMLGADSNLHAAVPMKTDLFRQ